MCEWTMREWSITCVSGLSHGGLVAKRRRKMRQMIIIYNKQNMAKNLNWLKETSWLFTRMKHTKEQYWFPPFYRNWSDF